MDKKTFLSKYVFGNPFTKIEKGYAIFSNGYRFNQNLIYCFIIGIVALGVFIFYGMGWNLNQQIYIRCDSMSYCENPFYMGNEFSKNDLLYNPAYHTLDNKYKKMCVYDWCSEPYLSSGFEFGRKPTFLEKNFGFVVMILLFVTVLLNHFIFNGGFNKDEGDNFETD